MLQGRLFAGRLYAGRLFGRIALEEPETPVESGYYSAGGRRIDYHRYSDRLEIPMQGEFEDEDEEIIITILMGVIQHGII